MKHFYRIFIVASLLLVSAGVFSQQGSFSLIGKVGYQSDYDRFGFGMDARIGLVDHIRVVPSFTFMVPNKDITGLEADLNLQYVFPIGGTALDIYPLTGLNMDNNKWSKHGESRKWTRWGYNIGVGSDYYITKSDFLNVEFQYTIGRDFARIMVGYGYKF